jgi:hypothetical protein
MLPEYPIKLPYISDYREYLPPNEYPILDSRPPQDPMIENIMKNNVKITPNKLTDEDFETTRRERPRSEGGYVQGGKLKVEVKVEFVSNPHEIVFPVDSMIVIYKNPDKTPTHVELVPGEEHNVQAGGRYRRNRRRSNRRRHLSRRRKNTRRQRKH